MILGPDSYARPDRGAAVAALGECITAGLILTLEIGLDATLAAADGLLLVVASLLLYRLIAFGIAAFAGPSPRLTPWILPPLALAIVAPLLDPAALLDPSRFGPVVGAVWSAALLVAVIARVGDASEDSAPPPLAQRLAWIFATTSAAALLMMTGVALGRSEGALPTALQFGLTLVSIPATVSLAALTGALVGLGLSRDILGLSKALRRNQDQPNAPVRVTRNDRLGAVQASLERERLELLDALAREAEAIAMLREANAAKVELIATLDHKLRTALTTILGHVELLELADPCWSEAERSSLLAIDTGAAHLLHQLRGLVDVAMIDTGQLRLDLRPLDLSALIDAALEAHRGPAEELGLSLHHQAPSPPLPPISADARRLREALDIVLTNAIDFSDEGTIELSAAVDESSGQVTIAVRDHGVGIPEDDISLIFKTRRRADGGVREGRRGLSLAIARAIAQGHGGTLTASSAPGEGSTFVLALPLFANPQPGSIDPSLLTAARDRTRTSPPEQAA